MAEWQIVTADVLWKTAKIVAHRLDGLFATLDDFQRPITVRQVAGTLIVNFAEEAD